MSDPSKKLNKQQQKATTHTDGPLLIVAGAGTGKTTALIERLKYLLDNKLAKLDEILLLTFTEKGAEEMEGRALQVLPYGYLELWISTFHGFCEKILRRHALDIGLSPDFKLLNQTEQWILIKNNLEKFNLDYYQPLGNPNKFIYELTTHFSRLKDEFILPEEYLEYAEGLKDGLDMGLADMNRRRKEISNDKFQISNKIQNPKSKFQNSKIKKIVSEIENSKIPKLISESKKSDHDVIDEQEIARINELANAYHVYNRLLIERGDFDFGDLICYTLKLFKERPNILKYYQKKFKYIMVDEFQDTNWAQYELIKLLAGKEPNLMVVGDDDQAIYKFRGASLSNIMQFKDDYPEAKEVILVKNYRSGQKILDSAYEFIKHNNPNRLEEKLKIKKSLESQTEHQGEVEARQFASASDEEACIADQILSLVDGENVNFSDFAILIRANSQADAFISELNSKNIPNTFVSMRGLYYKPVIMDLIAYLKLLDNYHESSALFRVLNMDPFDIGHSDIININRFARRKNWSLFEALSNHLAITDISKEARVKIDALLLAINKHSQMSSKTGASRLFVHIVNDLGILKNKDHDKEKEFFSLLNQFYQKIVKYEKTEPGIKLKEFMAFLELEFEAGETGSLKLDYEDSETVKIMTVHAAKGLEFKYVFIPQMVHKKFPTINRTEKIPLPDDLVKEVLPTGKQVHLEEERRLFYVAMTRAKEKLFLSGAKDCGGVTEKKMSIFIKEANLEVFEAGGGTENNQLLRDLAILNAPANEGASKYSPPKVFSFSQIEAYNNCPLQYKFNFIMKIPVMPKGTFVFGRVLHNVLHDFFLEMENGGGQRSLFADTEKTVKPDLKKLQDLYKKHWQEEGYDSKEEKEKYKKLGLEILGNFYADIEKEGWPAVEFLEKSFTAKIGNYPFRGAIDRIDSLSDGSWEVVDYKTGETPANFYYQNKKQLLLYKIAIEETLGKKVSQLTFHYLKSGEKKSFEAVDKDIDKFKAETLETVKKICSGDFTPNPGMLCGYCDFRGICEFRK